VLVVFLILLGISYWMQARVALPAPERFIRPDAGAYLVVRLEGADSEPRPPLWFPIRLITDGLPEQAARLVQKGAADLRCDFQVVLSVTRRNNTNETAMAISLGGYPGLFQLVRRDLERRCEKGLLDYRLHYYRDKAVFSGQRPGLRVVSLVRCSVLRSSSGPPMEALLDQFSLGVSEAPRGQAASQAPAIGPFSAWGWARGWEDLALDELSQTTDLDAPLQFKEALARDLPSITRFRDALFKISFPHGPLSASFEPGDLSEGPAIAAALPAWLEQNGPRVGVFAPHVLFRGGRVEASLQFKEGGR
jgi:hypothetical protein